IAGIPLRNNFTPAFDSKRPDQIEIPPRKRAEPHFHRLTQLLRKKRLDIEFFGHSALLPLDESLPQGFEFCFMLLKQPQSGTYHFARRSIPSGTELLADKDTEMITEHYGSMAR